MTDNSPNLITDMNRNIQEIQQTQRIRTMKTIPTHIVTKLFEINDDEKHLKSRGETSQSKQRGNKRKNDHRFLMESNASHKMVDRHL